MKREMYGRFKLPKFKGCIFAPNNLSLKILLFSGSDIKVFFTAICCEQKYKFVWLISRKRKLSSNRYDRGRE